MAGPLQGLRVVELSHEHAAWAGKLLTDLGAETVVVEPPGGSRQRTYGPFVDDEPGPERSLWWWYYNTAKRSVVLDLDRADDRERLLRMLDDADVVVEAEAPGRLAALGLGHEVLAARNPRLVHAAVTPFGQASARSHEPVTDLTLLAEGGPVWMCGYDDRELPPVRGGGNQAFHTGSHLAVMGVLAALLEREVSGRGQFVDVSIVAALNHTTEVGTYGYLGAGVVPLRQTGRHASHLVSQPVQALCADGRHVTTGLPPRSPKEFAALAEWMESLGLLEDFPLGFLLQLGAERASISLVEIATDPMVAEIFGAGREGLFFVASHVTAYEFFVGAQSRGMACGLIAAPEEVLDDPHQRARGFAVEVHHHDLDRSVVYPGAPYRFTGTPWELRGPAPHLGEHQDLAP